MVAATGSQFDVMQDITGTHWAPGDGVSPKIKDWLSFIGTNYAELAAYCGAAAQESYFEWCGLTVGYCMAMTGVRPVYGPIDVKRFLYATAWLGWGDKVDQPRQGDVVVFDWGGGSHHVTLFERDLANGYWACRGGNQSHEVKISNFPSRNVMGVRRPSAAAAPLVVANLQLADAVKVDAIIDVGGIAGAGGSVFSGAGQPLTQPALEEAAEKLGVGVAEIWALVFTETDPPNGGFWPDKRPQILYERHIFSRLSGGRFDQDYPGISNRHPGGYGQSGSHQYDRLSQAMALDEDAALQSASWGIGQVLGENFKAAGFASPQQLVTELFSSEDKQLAAVVAEIISDGAAGALAAHDWAAFARIYNGPNYAQNHYDTTLRTLYARFSGGASPDLRIRTAQLYLMYLGYDPAGIDGSWGKRTASALNQFQLAKGLPITQLLDEATFAALAANGAAVKGVELRAAASPLVG